MYKKIKTLCIVIFVSILYICILGSIFHFTVDIPVFTDKTEDGIALPIIMYHSILKDYDMSGKYVIMPSVLEQDIQYLKNRGFNFVSAQNLIDYVDSDIPLPEKPVMLTFDDGFYNNYTYVKPLLEKYDAKAVISVVGSYTDEYTESNIANTAYGYLRWCDVCDMVNDERIDIGNHSYDLHSNTDGRNGVKRKKGEDEKEYKEFFCADTKKAQEKFLENTDFSPVVYTYPFGAYTDETTDYLKEMGFRMSLGCTEKINIITKNPDCLFLMNRYNRPSDIRTSDFFEKILNEI